MDMKLCFSHTLRCLKTRCLQRYFGLNRGGNSRIDRTSNEDIRDLDSLNIATKVVKSRNSRQAPHVVRMGEMIEAYRGLVDKLEENKPFGRPTRQQQRNMTS